MDHLALVGGRHWTFVTLPQGCLHGPAICHGLVAWDLTAWGKSLMVPMFHCIDGMPTSDSLADLNAAAGSLQQALDSWSWVVQEPGLYP